MNPTMLSPSAALLLNLAVDILLKATMVLGLAGLVALVLRGTSAATRHAVWSVALGSLLVLPFLSASLPGWTPEVLRRSMSPAGSPTAPVVVKSDASVPTGPQLRDAAVAGVQVPAPTVAAAPTASVLTTVGPPAAALILTIWLAGVAVLLGRLGLNVLRVRRITRRAAECRLGDVRALTAKLAAAMGVWQPVRVLVSDEMTGPASIGTLAPAVILPSEVATWSTQRKRVVLLHELAHVKRWDYGVLLMIEIVCAVYWFNPFVWLAARRNAVERERACDDEALYRGVRSDVYAQHLLEIARSQVARELPRAAFAMAQPSSLAQRIRSILTRGQNRAPVSQPLLGLTAILALVVAIPLATVEVLDARVDQERSWQGSQEVARYIRELEADDPLVRRYAAWALGELESKTAVRPLVAHLEDDDADVRLVSAWALGEIKDRETIEPLVVLLDDGDPLVREMAVLALGEIEHRSAILPVIDAVGRHEELFEPAVWALGEIGKHSRAAREARSELIDHMNRSPWRNDEVWTGQVRTRGSTRGAHVPTLLDELTDPDPEVRRSAAERLGHVGDEQAIAALLDALRDPVPAVRAMAVWALDETNPSRSTGRRRAISRR